jgi:hypothetical protein
VEGFCIFEKQGPGLAVLPVAGERKEKEEIPAIKSRCAEFGTLICGSEM